MRGREMGIRDRWPLFRRHPERPAGPSRYVIPDGLQGRAGIQTGAPQIPAPRRCDWIPASAGMTAKNDVLPDGPQGRAGIQTGAPQVPAPCKSPWIPGSRCARPGMTPKKAERAVARRRRAAPAARTPDFAVQRARRRGIG